MLINLRIKGYNGIIPFVYTDKEERHKYMQYKVSLSLGQDNKSKKGIKMTAI